VERLRRTAVEARMAELPWQERMILSGRKWLDRAHKAFTLMLVGVSGEFFFCCCFFLGWVERGSVWV
jgi:hypothetical protein